jgi:drug/metabolite transporter (DMT)-like permease
VTDTRLRDTLFVAGAASSWGLWSLVLRPTELPATVTGTLLFWLMVAWTLPLALREPRVVWTRRTWGLLAGNVVFDGINVLTFFAALDRTTVAIAVITHYAAPVLVATAAPRIDGVRVRHAVPAALVALGGLALILEPWRGASETGWVGAALGLASAVAYAGNVFVVRRLTTEIGPIRVMCFHSIGSGMLLLPFAIGGFAAVELGDLALLALGTLTIGAIAGVAYLRGLAGIGATRAALLTFCEPLVAVAVGTAVWGEPLGAAAVAGAVLVIGAGVAVARASS